MKGLRYFVILGILTSVSVNGQDHYNVKKVYFSSDKFDEFSPVLTGNKIVFCSNRQDRQFVNYVTKEGKSLYKIFSVQLNDSVHKPKPEVFSRDLNTPYNDGPITFDTTGRKAFFSSNIEIGSGKKDKGWSNDNLGLFSGELRDGRWPDIKPFKYNNSAYSITTPFLSPDSKYLYFASDMPGGFGGSDLYRCRYIDSTWTEPENLGKVINTSGNEIYPFVNSSGDLFFASDGHQGLGKKDIFMSTETPSDWMPLIHLESPINSTGDDFSLITDSVFTSGYFASNRDGSDDIFSFETKIPQLNNCDTLKKNQYCFMFWDDRYSGSDSLSFEYEWQFSDGVILKGLSVEHCFPGAGRYQANLNIVDNSTRNVFLTQTSIEFDIKDFEQPFIASKDTGGVSEEIQFSGLKSNLPGFNITAYFWDFSDGSLMTGPDVSHSFKKEGIYNVRLGVTGKRIDKQMMETYCIFKPIKIYQNK